MKYAVLCTAVLGACRGAPKGGCPDGAVWVDAKLSASHACVYTARKVDELLRAKDSTTTTKEQP